MAHILLVEDDRDIAPLFAEALVEDGHKVDLAWTGMEAILMLELAPYALVLADGKLPDGSGLIIAEKAKARGIKVLIITGYAMDLPMDKLLQHEYLMKPVTLPDLREAVAKRLAAD